MLKPFATFAVFVFFRWVTVDGGIGFADDLKRVPEAYRASAERVEIEGGLDTYRKFTPAR